LECIGEAGSSENLSPLGVVVKIKKYCSEQRNVVFYSLHNTSEAFSCKKTTYWFEKGAKWHGKNCP